MSLTDLKDPKLCLDRQSLGLWGETRAKEWLIEQNFEICAMDLRPRRKWRAGQVDLLVRSPGAQKRIYWLVEVKTRRESRSAGEDLPLISFAQRRRLARSARLLSARLGGAVVGLALLWMEHPSGRVAFVEIPWYA